MTKGGLTTESKDITLYEPPFKANGHPILHDTKGSTAMAVL